MKARRIFIPLAVIAMAGALAACHKTSDAMPSQPLSDSKEVPLLPDKPYDYPASSNDYLAAFGRVLFYDKELSANKNISCGSCHQQEHAFTDGKQFSPGTDNVMGSRNAPSIFNKVGRLFWDGRANSLADLALRPVKNPVEMRAQDMTLLSERIGSLDYYQSLLRYAYPQATHVDTIMMKNALAEFLKNFNFSDTKFSRVQKGSERFTPSEQTGHDVFFNEGKCFNCHHVDGTNFNGPDQNSGYGVTNESHNIGLDASDSDLGVGGVTHQQFDHGAFMMPVLLNCELTAPYMHDGRFKTLEEVVDHYNENIKDNPNLDPVLRQFGQGPVKLNLTDDQKKGLVDFLKTLTDRNILTDQKFSNPFVQRPS